MVAEVGFEPTTGISDIIKLLAVVTSLMILTKAASATDSNDIT